MPADLKAENAKLKLKIKELKKHHLWVLTLLGDVLSILPLPKKLDEAEDLIVEEVHKLTLR